MNISCCCFVLFFVKNCLFTFLVIFKTICYLHKFSSSALSFLLFSSESVCHLVYEKKKRKTNLAVKSVSFSGAFVASSGSGSVLKEPFSSFESIFIIKYYIFLLLSL